MYFLNADMVTLIATPNATEDGSIIISGFRLTGITKYTVQGVIANGIMASRAL